MRMPEPRRLGLPGSTVGAALRRLGLCRLAALDPRPPVVRYERDNPGERIHLDIKKLGRIDGTGHRRALAWFERHGVRTARVITDNGSACTSCAFRDLLAEHGVCHKRTRPYTPRTNGKAERFIQASLREWAYARPFTTSAERAAAMALQPQPHQTSFRTRRKTTHLAPRHGQTPWQRQLGRVDKVDPLSDCGEEDEAQEACGGVIVAGRDASGVLEAVDEALDAVAQHVKGAVHGMLDAAVDGQSAAGMLDDLSAGQILLADRAYDSNALRAAMQAQGAWANIKPITHRLDPPAFSAFLYRDRNLVERFFNKMKHYRAIATRYHKRASNHLALVKLAAIPIWLPHHEAVT